MDKDDLFTNSMIVGGVIIGLVCLPFAGIYEGGKWFYKHTPWEQKKKKMLDMEIRQLEKKLGLHGRGEKALHYDPYYYKKKDRERKDYLNDLKIKLEKGYQSPDIIIVMKETASGLEASCFQGDCEVLVLIHKDYYNLPEDNEAAASVLGDADMYFRLFESFSKYAMDFSGQLRTLSECGQYEDYYIVRMSGKFKCHEVIAGGYGAEDFINKFKRENAIRHA